MNLKGPREEFIISGYSSKTRSLILRLKAANIFFQMGFSMLNKYLYVKNITVFNLYFTKEFQ